MNWKLSLLLDFMAARPQLDNESLFVKLFIKARLEFVQHGHRRADDITGQLFVKHAEEVNRGWCG